ncbi:MAG: alpha/beta fold hydrolase [Planctomycetota bacterium]
MPGPTSSAEVRRSLERLDAYANVAAPGEPGDERRVSALRHPVGDEGRRADLRLLYLHGTPGDAEGWADFLVDPVGDLPSSAVDRPGFGKSDTRSLATLEGQSRALAPFMGEAGVRTIVVGHSYGGPVALQAALDYPDEIAAAVILAGSVSPALEKRRWFNYAAKGLSWVLPRALRRSNQEVWPLRADLERLAKSLGEIRVPVVIVHGTDDGLVPYGNATFMEEALSGAASISLRTLDGAGHMFIWEERWVPTVREAILEAALKVQAAG